MTKQNGEERHGKVDRMEYRRKESDSKMARQVVGIARFEEGVRTEMKRDASGLLSAREPWLCSTAKYENSGGDFNLATMSIVSDC